MPNIQTKTFWSDALERPIKLTVSMKALRTIRKKGSLDNYLLSFSSTQLRSRMGDTLKEAIIKKLRDPTMRIPYIPNIYGKLVNPTSRRQNK